MGSPPHMRGKVDRKWTPTGICRITPAYAGKRSRTSHWWSWARDHPRICGEKIRAYVKIWAEWGSLPHMRGKVSCPEYHFLWRGITPAYAGKSFAPFALQMRPWDHPRICGEKSNEVVRVIQKPGSPPHMRGKDACCVWTRSLSRITPAYAGKRRSGGYWRQRRWDHPRICGEKLASAHKGPRAMGSPPHMRGKD